MKTLKAVETKRAAAWSLVVMFSFLQIAPSGLAVERVRPIDNAAGVSTNAGPETNADGQNVAELPSTIPSGAHEQFFTAGPLSPATPEPSPEAVEPSLEKAIVTDLVTGDAVGDPVDLELRESAAEAVAVSIPTLAKVGPPTDTAVITDPATGHELSVTVDEHNIATVRWGNQEYKGVFDPRTNSILLVTDDNGVWTVQFGVKTDGSLYLQSFTNENWSKTGYSKETYTFSDQGQLIRKDWLTESYSWGIFVDTSIKCLDYKGGCGQQSYSYRSGGTVDYVTINGKTIVSHEKTWSENSGYPPKYEYDLNGNMISVTYLYPYPSGITETESWYSYDGQGNLLAKSWNTSDSYGNSSFGQEQYIHINGRDLVSVRRVWQYGSSKRYIYPTIDDPIDVTYEYSAVKDPILLDISDDVISVSMYTSYHSETYYDYDDQGNRVAELTTWESYDFNGVRHTSASYSVYNSKIGTWESAHAEGLDISQIHSVKDYWIIENAAQRKTVYVGGGINQWSYTHHVEYTRNPDGTMTAKAVYDGQGHVWIVQGNPDVLSGEADDIKFQNGQLVGSQYVYYQEYWHYDANHNWVNEGYRLVFYDHTNWWSTTAVDYPTQTTVTLDGKEYAIEIDMDGNLTLTEIQIIPPNVQAYLDELQQRVGTGFNVTATLQADGTYKITVTDTKAYADQPPAGTLQEMDLIIDANGNFATGTIHVFYYGIQNVDGNQLFDGIQAVIMSADDITVLATMAQTQVDPIPDIPNLLYYFDWKGLSYRLCWGAALYVVVSIDEIRYEIAYLGNAEGEYQAKEYWDDRGNRFIVQGQPDILNGETDDIRFQQGQVVNGYEVYYAPFWHYDEHQNWVCDYRLVFYKSGTAFVDSIAVDYPTQTTVTLNGKEYKITIDQTGVLTLTENTIPPAVQAYVDALQQAVGSAYGVGAIRQEDGSYLVTVNFKTSEPCTPAGCPKVIFIPEPGQMTSMSFEITAEGQADISTLVVGYNFGAVSKEDAANGVTQPVVDAQLLYEALQQIKTYQMTDPHSRVEPTYDGYPVIDAWIVKMTQINVTRVDSDGAIHFINTDGRMYKTYRDADGTVRVEEVALALPADVLLEAQANLPADQLEQLNAAMLDVGPNSQYIYQESTDGKTKAWIWTSADGKTTYALRDSFDYLVPAADGTFQTVERWSFDAQTLVSADEVRTAAAELPENQEAEAVAAIDQAVAGGVTEFVKTVSGNDVSYQWRNPTELDRTYSMAIGLNGEVQYSIQQQVDVSDVSSDTAVVVYVDQDAADAAAEEAANADQLNAQQDAVAAAAEEAAQIAKEEDKENAKKNSRNLKNFRKKLARAKTQDRKAGNNQRSVAVPEKESTLLKSLIGELTK